MSQTAIISETLIVGTPVIVINQHSEFRGRTGHVAINTSESRMGQMYRVIFDTPYELETQIIADSMFFATELSHN